MEVRLAECSKLPRAGKVTMALLTTGGFSHSPAIQKVDSENAIPKRPQALGVSLHCGKRLELGVVSRKRTPLAMRRSSESA